MPEKPVLWSFYSSSCSSRVRTALDLKKIDYEYRTVGLLHGEEPEGFAERNPARKVPILEINGLILTESMAILEYLDEVYPEPPFLPKEPEMRAHVRAVAFHIVSNIQPLQNMVIVNMVDKKNPGYGIEWAQIHINKGFTALEKLLNLYSGKFCVGDQLTIADIVLPSIVYNAVVKYSVDMTPYPIISRISKSLMEIPEFQSSHPDSQPDAPKTN